MPRFQKKDMSKIPLRHDWIIGSIAMWIIKTVLRYALMAAYLMACNEFGLYNYGWISKIVIWLTSICLSRWVMREIGIILGGQKMDDPLFEEIGLIACIRNIGQLLGRW
jgi:hypothetical protein